MRLLIVTQIVDCKDPTLGFFHRWIEEFAKHVEYVEVICLFEGEWSLPQNVRVHSLGKERGAVAWPFYALRFLSLVWRLRRDYDIVFVHMNVEYLLLAGAFWRLLHKRVALWYVHGTVSLRLRLAVILAHVVLTASPESMRLVTSKKRVVGHGIDTEFFSPDERVVRSLDILSAGRLTKSKRHGLIIRAAKEAKRTLRIIGEGPERTALEVLAKDLGAPVVFLGGLSQEVLRNEYRRAAFFVHTSTTGSMDKVVLEALACGCPVITTSSSYEGLPVAQVAATSEAIGNAVQKVPCSREEWSSSIRERFSLSSLIPRIMKELSS